jgi:hypothetical protein
MQKVPCCWATRGFLRFDGNGAQFGAFQTSAGYWTVSPVTFPNGVIS